MKPTKTCPGFHILKKDLSILMFTDKMLHGETFQCGPHEMFGFGAGALTVDAAAAFQGKTWGTSTGLKTCSRVLRFRVAGSCCYSLSCCSAGGKMGVTVFKILRATEYVVAVDDGKKELTRVCDLLYQAILSPTPPTLNRRPGFFKS